MFQEFYRHIPQNIDPVVFTIGSFNLRWYGLAYLGGFIVVYGLLRLRIVKNECVFFTKKEDALAAVFDFLLVAFFSALIGGRLGYVFFYDPAYFFAHPFSIISPFSQDGSFAGLYGMSYHGALLAIILGSYLFLRKKRINFLDWADFVAPTVAMGYFFGRIGNFLNGELYGRITNSSLGMFFPSDPYNLRHPSQLHEAFLEGIVLFVILWKIRNKKMRKGSIFAAYLIGYGALRALAEQFRQPDAQIGYLFGLVTQGQLFSFVMILAGLVLLISKKEIDAIMKAGNIFKKV
ncbi:MAG: hypothetical protein ACD_9C00246G0007 [uncultured bacterium]|nr:MAG: hypothetical protein ACD_9C00246G0007 [uncultured bacterium]